MKLPVNKELSKQLSDLITEDPLPPVNVMQLAMMGMLHSSQYEDGKAYFGMANGTQQVVLTWCASRGRFYGILIDSHLMKRKRANITEFYTPYNDTGGDIFMPLMKLSEERQQRGWNANRRKQYSYLGFRDVL